MLTEQEKLFEHYKEYFNYYKLETSLRGIFAYPQKDDTVFKYQCKFIRLYLINKLKLNVISASECFALFLNCVAQDKKKRRKLTEEQKHKLVLDNFVNNKYVDYDTFCINEYKEYLQKTFGFCYALIESASISINQQVLKYTKEECSDASFKMYITLLLTNRKTFAKNEIIEICNVSRAKFYRVIKELETLKLIEKRNLDSAYCIKTLRVYHNANDLKYVYYFNQTKLNNMIDKLDDNAFRLYIKLNALQSVRDVNKAEITLETLADWLQINKSNVLRAISKLLDLKIIKVTKHKYKNNYAHNVYRFNSEYVCY